MTSKNLPMKIILFFNLRIEKNYCNGRMCTLINENCHIAFLYGVFQIENSICNKKDYSLMQKKLSVLYQKLPETKKETTASTTINVLSSL
jgi:hypothetical protein